MKKTYTRKNKGEKSSKVNLKCGTRKIFYRKLIRDKIPEKMTRVGAAFEVRELGKREFEKELLKKVGEEASGLLSARNKSELVEELADVLDVIEEIMGLKKIKSSEIQKRMPTKKGDFEKEYI